MAKLKVRFSVDDGGVAVDLLAIGRDGWALLELVKAGANGCTPISTPGPRWSHYVWKLRGMGVVIDTIDEKHSGPFAGTHARYILRSNVRVLDVEGAEWRAAA
jgi:hypothetical protein